jgi:hypothetical protein
MAACPQEALDANESLRQADENPPLIRHGENDVCHGDWLGAAFVQ